MTSAKAIFLQAHGIPVNHLAKNCSSVMFWPVFHNHLPLVAGGCKIDAAGKLFLVPIPCVMSIAVSQSIDVGVGEKAGVVRHDKDSSIPYSLRLVHLFYEAASQSELPLCNTHKFVRTTEMKTQGHRQRWDQGERPLETDLNTLEPFKRLLSDLGAV